MRKYNMSAVEKLQAQQTEEMVDGASIIIKKSPSESRGGYLDKDELAVMQSRPTTESVDPRTLPPDEMLEALRDSMGFPNQNLCTVEIYTQFETLHINGNDVGLWRYYPRKTRRRKDRPCLIYLHGGGWVGGTPYAVENPCRLIAELADAVVFNVDYSLAPEKKYPNGFRDCYGVVEHVYKHAEAYGIDRSKIAVGGDSAGGNLTAAIACKDRDEGTGMVALQVLLYACVTLENDDVPEYEWRLDAYEMSDEQRVIIDPCLALGRPVKDGNESNVMREMYIDHAAGQVRDPYVSPLLGDLTGLPRLLSVSCEYDGLRIQDELYAKKLREAGTEVKSIRYRGITHAVIDRLGYVPQAEDICMEIACAMKAM